MDLLKLKQSIKKYEDLRLKPYFCPAKKLTIGYGRNLQDNGITYTEAELMLENDLLNLKLELIDGLPVFKTLNSVRQNVILEMAYNMGLPHLLEFKNTIKYLEKKMFLEASKEMLDSAWHRDFIKYDLQDGKKSKVLRSEYLSQLMEKGEF